MTAAEAGKGRLSSRAFFQGLAAGILVYAGIALWLFLSADKAEDMQMQRLASQTVIVEWLTPPEPERAAPAEEMGPYQEEVAAEALDPADPSIMESGLAEAPVEGLYEDTSMGHLPVARKDGLTAFAAYRRPFDVYASDKPIVSIAIAGLGLSNVATESAVRTMPPDVSFIMSPYAETLDFWIRESRARGHEIWLTLPMETARYPVDDPGPHTMLIGVPERENQMKLEWLMSRADGYAGFVTSFQPDFMQSVNDMRPIVSNLYNRGLAFVDGSAPAGIVPQTMAAGMKAPYSTVDIWIDMPDSSQQAIDEALAKLEQQAKEKGYAVGVIHALPVSYQQTLDWIKRLPQKGLRLAPLSATTGY